MLHMSNIVRDVHFNHGRLLYIYLFIYFYFLLELFSDMNAPLNVKIQ